MAGQPAVLTNFDRIHTARTPRARIDNIDQLQRSELVRNRAIDANKRDGPQQLKRTRKITGAKVQARVPGVDPEFRQCCVVHWRRCGVRHGITAYCKTQWWRNAGSSLRPPLEIGECVDFCGGHAHKATSFDARWEREGARAGPSTSEQGYKV